MKLHNPPAFPQSEWAFAGGDGREGMTLRDWLAGQAINGVLYATASGNHTSKHIVSGAAKDTVAAMAMDAYSIADAMLAARARDALTNSEGGGE